MSEFVEEYKKEKSSGTGTETAYTVEARHNFMEPVKIGKQIFDDKWRKVSFNKGAIGVPPARAFYRHTIEHGMLSYQAAQALRWWLHAACDELCLETRLVKHTIEHSYKITAVSFHEHVHGEDRSNCVPDWGKKPDPTPKGG